MESFDSRSRTRPRHEQRLGLLRRRSALASGLGFVAFLGLAAQHAVGSARHHAPRGASPPATGPVRYFDQQADGFAFDDGASALPPPPPVAQTNVS